MKNLFVVDGASGTGKTELLEYIFSYSSGMEVIPKYTTREQRDYEKVRGYTLDLKFVSSKQFDTKNLYYKYTYGREHYGFSKKKVDITAAS